METSSLVIVALVPLIAWRLYSRVKRLLSRQKSRLWRHWIAAIFFPLLIVMLGLVTALHPFAFAGLALGVCGGIALAIWGIKLTRFESTAEGFFYTPNARIGLALSALLVMRIVYRFMQIGMGGFRDAAANPDFARSPVTQVIIGLVLAYYAVYAMGLLRWRRAGRVEPLTSAAGEAATSKTPERK
jgi:cytochrome b561